jgi:SAM-dependent methyltransferase
MSATITPYKVMYFLGFKPWDNGKIPQALREVVEGSDRMPPGQALDLGCGTGTHAVYLAQHGWQVTGIDLVPRALEEARKKARAADVTPAFIAADITRLTDVAPGRDYSLVLDVACFHGLLEAQRRRTALQITEVTRRGGVFLLFGFQPGNRGPLPSGIDRDEVVRLFGREWELVWEREASDAPRLRGPLKNARPTAYLLRRI